MQRNDMSVIMTELTCRMNERNQDMEDHHVMTDQRLSNNTVDHVEIKTV
jgi:hypothetical protein